MGKIDYKKRSQDQAKAIAELKAAVKRLEDVNASLVEEVTEARNETLAANQIVINRVKADAQTAFRTVEVFVYNENRKNSSRQYFGIAEGAGMRFSVDADGCIHSHTEPKKKDVPIS